MYDWLLKGTDNIETENTLKESETESFYSKMNELYQIRVESGLEEVTKISTETELELPEIDLCDIQTVDLAQKYSEFIKEYELRGASMEDLLVFIKKTKEWI